MVIHVNENRHKLSLSERVIITIIFSCSDATHHFLEGEFFSEFKGKWIYNTVNGSSFTCADYPYRWVPIPLITCGKWLASEMFLYWGQITLVCNTSWEVITTSACLMFFFLKQNRVKTDHNFQTRANFYKGQHWGTSLWGLRSPIFVLGVFIFFSSTLR